jgi:hypothetical protein
MKNTFQLFAILLLVSGIFACKKDDDNDNNSNPGPSYINFYSNLKGSSEVPPNSSAATGTATGSFNQSTKVLTVTVTYSGMGVTAGHIHNGSVGVDGPVVFPFTSTASPITFTSTPLNATQEADLMANRYYINLHSLAYTDGEIRGQLFQSNTVSFYADLKGSSETPPNASTATGNAIASFNKDTKILTVVTTYSGMTATAGHVHKGAIGSAGPVVFPFTSTASPIVFTSTALDAGQEADLMANMYYVNLHSAAFPDGEIRGQLMKHP